MRYTLPIQGTTRSAEAAISPSLAHVMKIFTSNTPHIAFKRPRTSKSRKATKTSSDTQCGGEKQARDAYLIDMGDMGLPLLPEEDDVDERRCDASNRRSCCMSSSSLPSRRSM